MFDTLRKEDLSDCLHEALKVKLEDGSLFVIDLVGPQYGLYVPVMPYDTYLKKMARDKSSVTDHPFGYQRAWMVKACIPRFLEDPWYIYDTRIPKADEQLYHTFNECLKSWQSKKMPLTAMLNLKERMYLETQKDLLTAVEKTLCDARFKIEKFPQGLPKSPSSMPVPVPKPKTKERTFEEDCAEFLRSASSNGHAVLDVRGLKF
ncbi:MAG: hypothetical protein Q9199_003412 [Rusavskia elegans]